MPVRDFTINTGLEVSGSTRVSGSVSASGGFTGSLQGTASYGQEANLLDGRDSTEFALTGSTNYFKADQIVSGNLTVTASLTASNITGATARLNYLDFVEQTPTPNYSAGRLHYDNDTGDLTFDTSVADLRLFLGQQIIVKANNQTGGTLTKDTVVRIIGEQGDRPTIVTASWENDNNSATTLGLVMRDIAHQADGYVILQGLLTNLNTTQYNVPAGSQLYLSSSGEITGGVPPTPYHEVRLGQIIRVHSTAGSIFVRIQNGYELNELHNLDLVTEQNGDLLRYRSSDGQWINSKILTGSYQLTGGLDVLGNVSASTITGSFSGLMNGVGTVVAGANLTSSVNNGNLVLNLTSSITGGLDNLTSSGDILVNLKRIGNGPGTGNNNTVLGEDALINATTANANVIVGDYNAYGLTTGQLNVVIGYASMGSAGNTSKNTAIGADSLGQLTSGGDNIAIGNIAGFSMTAGKNNVIIGSNNGANINNTTGSIIISDGGGNIRLTANSAGNVTVPSGSLFVSGALIVSGNVILGDATTDTVTLTAATMSLESGTGLLNIDSNTLYVNGNANKVGFGTNNIAASALVEMSGTNLGLLFPRVSGSARATMTGATGLIVYQTDTSGSDAEGLYIYKSSGWVQII